MEAPAEPLNAVPTEPAPRVFDLALFESLNDEYSSHPIVAEAPRYDMTSVVERSRRRLLGIHSRIDLMNKVVLEIGCGWGGFAIHAARSAGCRVTGITLSEEQAALARERVKQEGLEDRIDIRLEDYREVPDRFTAVASIEMFE